ncbi:QPCT [Bugula neritina]|uniref:Glutaminyl-peptide cyclotransferase n=1 Tax=Bugula neritina TaxID=10212 RepID=A0A7J7JIQ9_BUGNE|nr:QPCT [Bugula neritina]
MGARFRWTIEEDNFTADTPIGVKKFNNIVATLDPSAKRFLVLACHFDSKYFKDFTFIGATDSAVPCAMMIDFARSLYRSLRRHRKSATRDISLQFIFFDGEEAFQQWTATDSLYGSRHLAAKWEATPNPLNSSSTRLDSIDAFILLDLLGARNPRFYNFFPEDTGRLYDRLRTTEAELHQLGHVKQHQLENQYFTNIAGRGTIQDDHIPFLQRGVPILHLISAPFPQVWHSRYDDESALDYVTIDNLNKILRVFVAEYLHLDV